MVYLQYVESTLNMYIRFHDDVTNLFKFIDQWRPCCLYDWVGLYIICVSCTNKANQQDWCRLVHKQNSHRKKIYILQKIQQSKQTSVVYFVKLIQEFWVYTCLTLLFSTFIGSLPVTPTLQSPLAGGVDLHLCAPLCLPNAGRQQLTTLSPTRPAADLLHRPRERSPLSFGSWD